jgi:Tfp pilus assembly protein PilX
MKVLNNNHPSIAQDQTGLASIVVTLVMMLVLTLIVIGFATVSRREQTDALNSQLSTQAFYAAESGVNDAWQDIVAAGLPVTAKTTCGAGSGPSNPYTNLTGTIDSALNVQYTCLLVNANLSNQKLDGVSSSQSVSFHGVDLTGNPVPSIGSLDFKWNTSGGGSASTGCTGSKTFPAAMPNNCNFGVIEVEIVPVDPNSTTLSQGAFTNNEFTTYLVPSSTNGSTGTVNYSGCDPGAPAATCGQIVQAVNCASGSCEATVTGLSSDYYAVRVRSIYKTSDITISPPSGTLLSGGQVSIDSTGEANDVLRRIQVRFALSPEPTLPDAAIETTDTVCKRFEVSQNYYMDESGDTDCGANSGITTPPPTVGTPVSPQCTLKYDSNKIQDPDFSLTYGDGDTGGNTATTDPNPYFQTDLPYRGPGIYPDDTGQDGYPNWNGIGWYGGFSIEKGPIALGADQYSSLGGPMNYTSAVVAYPFPGDSTVPGTQYYFYSNPNQSDEDPKGTFDYKPDVDFIWGQTINNLIPNTNYEFRVYIANAHTTTDENNGVPYTNAVDPQIQISVNTGTGSQTYPVTGNKDLPEFDANGQDINDWQPMSIIFSSGASTSVTVQVHDYAHAIDDDDFIMTAMGLYSCE